MRLISSYIRLMRLDKPTGIVLLWSPTAFALWIASNTTPNFYYCMLFLFGTIIMRSAGCIINDIADRNIDQHVKRTTTRPLASKELSLKSALVLFVILLFIALVIVMQLPILCLYEAIIALLITIIYPFCKRFIEAPQLVLGIAFSMSIPMVYATVDKPFTLSMVVLLIINYLWIVSYDTIYAMVDKDDDLLIGVKSTAILFGNYDRIIIASLQIVFHSLWLLQGYIVHLHMMFYLGWVIGALLLLYQNILINKNARDSYFKAFLLNGWYGTVMWIGLVLDKLYIS